MSIEETIKERGALYGDFETHAQISQEIQNAIIKGWFRRAEPADQPAYILEALTMIAHKIGRIVNGDIYYEDSWRDIAGYATLVANKINEEQHEALQESKE